MANEVWGSRKGLEFMHDLNRYNHWTYTNLEFLSRFRFRKRPVADLCADFLESGFCGLQDELASAQLNQYGYDERMLQMLRYMSSGADFKNIADGTVRNSKTTVSRCVWEAVDFIYYNHERYIRWPQTPGELEELSLLYDVRGFDYKPKIVGSADCMHVAISTPKHEWQEEAYVNRKGYHSINTLLICDANCNVLHVDARWPGSASDAYIFNCSEVRDFGDRGLFGDYFLLADQGFRARDYMLTPFYGDEDTLTRPQIRYNNWHAKARSPIERTNGQIKMRFRLLDSTSGVIDHSPDKVCKLITVAACLHNLAKHLNEVDPPPDPYHATRQPRPERPQPETVPIINQDNLRRRDEYVRAYFGI